MRKNDVTVDQAIDTLKFLDTQNYIAIIDLEATCTDDDKEENFFNEIIEIGCVIWDRPKNEFVEYQIYVKPKVSVITPFCVKLTGISDETLEDAMSFSDSLNQLDIIFDIWPQVTTWISFGDYDRNMFERQTKREDLKNPMNRLNHVNIKKVAWSMSGVAKSAGLEGMLQRFGLKFEGSPHSGIDDSYNIAKLTEKLITLI